MRRMFAVTMVGLFALVGCSIDEATAVTATTKAAETTTTTAKPVVNLVRCEDTLGAAYMGMRAGLLADPARSASRETLWADGVDAFNEARELCAGACELMDDWLNGVAPDEIKAAEALVLAGEAGGSMSDRLKYANPVEACE